MSSRRGTYVTDLRHFLTDDGDLIHDLPTPALNLALHVASIVAWVTNQRTIAEYEWTTVPCRRTPKRRRCPADIMVAFESAPVFDIRWWCPVCGDNGFVYGWERSLWDRGEWSEKDSVEH
jgi:hypothetical protein